MERLLSIATAAGTAHTNSTDEAVLASYSCPADSWQVGKAYLVRGLARATATNSTDTLTVNIRIGGTTLTGTICATSGAVDVANNDIVAFDLTIVPRTVGSSGTALVSGFCSAAGAEGTVTARGAFESLSSLDTTAAILIEMTADWSVANAGNSAQSESFIVTELF